MSRNPKYTKLINSWKWQKLRREQLSRKPLCEVCEQRGRVVAATEVHHKTPVESVSDFAGMEFLAYDRTNLMSLCHDCHREIHDIMPRRPIQGKRTKKRENKLLTAQIVGNFARFLPQKEENNGTIQRD